MQTSQIPALPSPPPARRRGGIRQPGLPGWAACAQTGVVRSCRFAEAGRGAFRSDKEGEPLEQHAHARAHIGCLVVHGPLLGVQEGVDRVAPLFTVTAAAAAAAAGVRSPPVGAKCPRARQHAGEAFSTARDLIPIIDRTRKSAPALVLSFRAIKNKADGIPKTCPALILRSYFVGGFLFGDLIGLWARPGRHTGTWTSSASRTARALAQTALGSLLVAGQNPEKVAPHLYYILGQLGIRRTESGSDAPHLYYI